MQIGVKKQGDKVRWRCSRLFTAFWVITGAEVLYAQTVPAPVSPLQDAPTDAAQVTLKEADIEAALEASKKKSPTLYGDALRIWKGFDKKSKAPHYSYYFWAVDLIMWLKKERDVVFDSEAKIALFFKFLFNKGLISEYAVLTLTRHTWGHLIHLEGVPDWDKSKKQEGECPLPYIPAGLAPGKKAYQAA